MQRRSNRDRTEATRTDLIRAARRLFTEKSYAETGTPEIVAAAGVTRGALYHHFADKQALFAAVVEQEAATVAAEIDRASPAPLSARDALIAGSDAYLAAMRARSIVKLPVDALTALLAAAFDRAALAIEAGASGEDYRAALIALMDGLSPAPAPSKRPAPSR
ncbi:MAG: TetR family transcriptional regulator [Mesorhizobium sp.]|nr:MAG: TetR family transcriptional regulator [Mesorhizobium sp.]